MALLSETAIITIYTDKQVFDFNTLEVRDFVRLSVLEDFTKSLREQDPNAVKNELQTGKYDKQAMDFAFAMAITHNEIFVEYLKKWCEVDGVEDGYQLDCDFEEFSIQEEDGEYNLYLDTNGVIIRKGDTVKWNKVQKAIYADILGGDYADGLGIKWQNYPAAQLRDENYTTQKVSVLYGGEEQDVNICTLTEWEKV